MQTQIKSKLKSKFKLKFKFKLKLKLKFKLKFKSKFKFKFKPKFKFKFKFKFRFKFKFKFQSHQVFTPRFEDSLHIIPERRKDTLHGCQFQLSVQQASVALAPACWQESVREVLWKMSGWMTLRSVWRVLRHPISMSLKSNSLNARLPSTSALHSLNLSATCTVQPRVRRHSTCWIVWTRLMLSLVD